MINVIVIVLLKCFVCMHTVKGFWGFILCVFVVLVRDRVRTKMERDILVEVNHPFIVKLHYGESLTSHNQMLVHLSLLVSYLMSS